MVISWGLTKSIQLIVANTSAQLCLLKKQQNGVVTCGSWPHWPSSGHMSHTNDRIWRKVSQI